MFVAGQTSCDTQCPAGHECPGSTVATPCSKGSYSDLGVSSCTECTDGYYATSTGENISVYLGVVEETEVVMA